MRRHFGIAQRPGRYGVAPPTGARDRALVCGGIFKSCSGRQGAARPIPAPAHDNDAGVGRV